MWIKKQEYSNINYEIQRLKERTEAQERTISALLRHLNLRRWDTPAEPGRTEFIDNDEYRKRLDDRAKESAARNLEYLRTNSQSPYYPHPQIPGMSGLFGLGL